MTETYAAPRWYSRAGARSWTCAPLPREVLAFHQGLDGYAPTALVEVSELATELGVGRVLVKDESSRLGLPAFKALGASWAIHRALVERTDNGRPALLVTATDGNHGRAVTRVARTLGHSAHIVIPRGVHPAAVQAIVDEGAEVEQLDGDYDEAVARAAELAATTDDAILVQDTAWEGYEEIPGWIVEGYSTMVREVDAQLGDAIADLVVVPVGVGSLAQSVVAHYRSGTVRPALLAVEPDSAAGVLASLEAGALTSVPTSETVMAGLNCGTPSTLAWPYLAGGLDAAIAVTDQQAALAATDLARLGVRAGPCGASTLAGLRAALEGPDADDCRRALGLTADSVVVLLSTEGADANPSTVIDLL